MIEAIHFTSYGAAFVAGLVTSLHCVGMCGPMGCLFMKVGRSEGAAAMASILYHSTRLLSYALIGALAAVLGGGFVNALYSGSVRLMPWMCVFLLLAIGLGLDSRIPRLRWHAKIFSRMRIKWGTLSPMQAALGVGFLTPLIPCGPLYLLFGVLLASGSAVEGAGIALSFGLGTVPLLFLAHTQYGRWQSRLGHRRSRWLRQGLALLAALFVMMRLVSLSAFDGVNVDEGVPDCCNVLKEAE